MIVSEVEVAFWQKTAADLDLDIIAPFELALPGGQTLLVSALVKHFGPRGGMVVNANYDTLRPHVEYLKGCGFGFASGIGTQPDNYKRSVLIEVLQDWGWSGPSGQKPNWL